MTRIVVVCLAALLVAISPPQIPGPITNGIPLTGAYMMTLAGTTRGFGGDAGLAVDAQLYAPSDMVVAPTGEIYIADTYNHRIRKVFTTGVITTVAGTGAPGFSGDGGPALDAQLQRPWGLALDPGGNLYFADADNLRVRRIDAVTQTIATVAGGGSGDDGSLATDAALTLPRGIAIGPAGNLFIADGTRVRRVTASTGIIDTVAGSTVGGDSGDGGPATAALLTKVFDIVVDPTGAGDLYLSDRESHRVRHVDLWSGIITTVAGTGVAGYSDAKVATAAQLNRPTGLALDAKGNLYIADSYNYRIRRMHRVDGYIWTVAGNGARGLAGDGGDPTIARVAEVLNVATDDVGNLYLADAYNDRIRKVITGWHDDVPLAGDLDGDGRADLVLWRAQTASFMWLTSSSGYANSAAETRAIGGGAPGDVPLLGDMDGDGKQDLVLWRAATASFYWLTSATNWDVAQAQEVRFGNKVLGDIPFLGQIDTDGKADLIIWRPTVTAGTWGAGGSPARWFWLRSSDGFVDTGWGGCGPFDTDPSDVPLVADLGEAGRSSLIQWRGRTGTWMWFNSAAPMWGCDNFRSVQWGSGAWGDVPLTANLVGSGHAEDLAVWRTREGIWFWLQTNPYCFPSRYEPGRSICDQNFYYESSGMAGWGCADLGDVPLSADFDGDGRADFGVWRASTGTWHWLSGPSSSSSWQAGVQWGSTR